MVWITLYILNMPHMLLGQCCYFPELVPHFGTFQIFGTFSRNLWDSRNFPEYGPFLWTFRNIAHFSELFEIFSVFFFCIVSRFLRLFYFLFGIFPDYWSFFGILEFFPCSRHFLEFFSGISVIFVIFRNFGHFYPEFPRKIKFHSVHVHSVWCPLCLLAVFNCPDGSWSLLKRTF